MAYLARKEYRQPLIHLLFAYSALLAVCALLAGCGSDNSGTTQSQSDRQANETALKADLQTLRNAVEQFQSDSGCCPNNLADLVAAQPGPSTGIDNNGNSLSIPAGSYKGPYFSPQGGIDDSGIPMNPFAPPPTGNLTNDINASWIYTTSGAKTSTIHCAVPTSGTTLNGIPYNQL